MKRHRHTPEQIVRKLREGERLLNEGKDVTEVIRHLEVSEASRGWVRAVTRGYPETFTDGVGPLSWANARRRMASHRLERPAAVPRRRGSVCRR